MPDAATVAAGASIIGVIVTTIVGCCMARLLRLQGEYNRLLRETLEVYDPKKVIERMRAFKESAELAAQEEIKKGQAQVAAARADIAMLRTLHTGSVKEAEEVKSLLAIVLTMNPIDHTTFLAQPRVPEKIKQDVQEYMNVLAPKKAKPTPLLSLLERGP